MSALSECYFRPKGAFGKSDKITALAENTKLVLSDTSENMIIRF